MYNIGKLRVITRWMVVADCTYKNIFYSLIIKFHLMFNSLLRNEIEKSILILFYATGFIIIEMGKALHRVVYLPLSECVDKVI